MDLSRNNIRMNKIVKSEVANFYVNHEDRITEADKPINNVVAWKDFVTLDNVSVRNGQVVINGTVSYEMLYYSDGSDMICGIENEIPFEENVKINGIDDNCNAQVKLVVISSSVKTVDEENYIYKTTIMAYITIEQLEDMEVIEKYRKSVVSPNVKNSPEVVKIANTLLSRVREKLQQSAEKVLKKVQAVLLKPEVKQAGKEQIKNKARKSIKEKLAQGKLDADRENRERWEREGRIAPTRKQDMEL